MKNNKGFSLVELIIVIAIMAILIGVMAPQLIKYIEKSNVSSDSQLCDTVRTAITTAMMDPEVINSTDYKDPTDGAAVSTLDMGTTANAAIEDTLGCKLADVEKQLKSSFQGSKASEMKIKFEGANQLTVYLNKSCAEGKKGNSDCTNCTKISAGPADKSTL